MSGSGVGKCARFFAGVWARGLFSLLHAGSTVGSGDTGPVDGNNETFPGHRRI
jgi:hypothetical protein